MVSSRTVLTCAVLGSLVLNLGCGNMLHNLQPHRIQRLNRGPAPSIDPEFSEWKPKRQIRMAKKDSAVKVPTLSANSAEIVIVRAQTPVAETR